MTTSVDELFREYRSSGDQAIRNKLVEAHVPLVHYVASRMLPTQHSSVQLQDLIAYGMPGLIDAAEKYDPDRESKASFATFASYRIQGAITDELRSQAWEPRAIRAMHRRHTLGAAELEMRLGRPPSLKELSTHVGDSEADISRAAREMDSARVGSLSAPVKSEGEVITLSEVVVAPISDSEPIVRDMSKAVASAIGRLPETEQLLLRLIYVQHMMLRDIAVVLGVTDSWVSHLHTRCMVSLQRALAAQY